MVARELDGKRVLLTGATGFVGQAVLERLLVDVPGASLVVIARPRGGTSARDRVAKLLDAPVFAAAVERLGADALRDAFDQRVTVLEGGLGDKQPALPGDLDVVIHCAATVAFDPPVDEGFTTNLLGATGLYEAVRASGSTPHIVHVSTAYVAGVRKGVVEERPLQHRVDWRAELDAALAARTQVERGSRRPAVLDRLMAKAREQHRRAGPQTVAADTERRRAEWVSEQLVEYGRARAHSLGWPDVYTLTKALGERATEELASHDWPGAAAGDDQGALSLSIVRPSIVESALRYPKPGWIVGFKMAEPIILAFGRGTLPEFPAVPDGIIDIIPVDHVANALVAIAANPPAPGTPAYYHVSSGARNPLSFRGLYEHVRDYFTAHPLPDPEHGAARLPVWDFPGATRVERMLRTGERMVDAADKAVERLPRSSRTRELATRVHRNRRQVEFIRRYADLYGAYTEAEVLYPDDAVRTLYESLSAEEQRTFDFDITALDWHHYIQRVHCPAITEVMRAAPGGRSGLIAPPRPEPKPQALAVFDLEGTLVSSNVVESFLWVRLADLPLSVWPKELAAVASGLPALVAADRRDRGEFLRAFYRRYAGASPEALARLIDEEVGDLLLRRLAPAAIRQVRRHRAAGHRTVLLTGALEPLVEPLRPLFDDVLGTRLAVEEGRYTGFLDQPPLVGEARAAWLRKHAARVEGDLAVSYGYGDSHSDVPLLEAVGTPVAVNPDAGLYRVARRRRWPVAEWTQAAGARKVHLPTPRGA